MTGTYFRCLDCGLRSLPYTVRGVVRSICEGARLHAEMDEHAALVFDGPQAFIYEMRDGVVHVERVRPPREVAHGL